MTLDLGQFWLTIIPHVFVYENFTKRFTWQLSLLKNRQFQSLKVAKRGTYDKEQSPVQLSLKINSDIDTSVSIFKNDHHKNSEVRLVWPYTMYD